MTKFRRLHSVNFILWMSFLIFAAFILLLTWIFQTTLLRVFFQQETEDELHSMGEEIIKFVSWNVPLTDGNGAMDVYIERMQDENTAATVFLLDGDGQILYPTGAQEVDSASSGSDEGYPDESTFELVCSRMKDREVSVKLSDNCYAYAARIENGALSDTGISDLYVYVSYSTQLAQSAMGTMRVQLVMISVIVVFLALIVSAWLSMVLTKPITRITKAARRMAAGDFTVNFKGEFSYAEMDALAETLDYAKDEIGKSDQLQKEVLANVTHDLKTPLTMIKAYASMIQEISGDNPEKRAKHTQVIIDESDRLTSLVNDILNLSKIRSGMDVLKTQVFNLSEFVHTVLERFDYLTETQGYTIERDIEDELYTEADEEKMEQVVYNLVGNAVNYTGEDKKIVVSLHKTGQGTIRLGVRDTGKGIPPEEIKTIWDRYYRSAETHKRPVRGTGLGLSIVKTILVKHGFEYGVESEVGKGSTFYVVFPEK